MIPTRIKHLGINDEHIAFMIYEGLTVKQMSEKMAWTERRIAKWINTHWKISGRLYELREAKDRINWLKDFS